MRLKNAFVFAFYKHDKAALGISAKYRFIAYLLSPCRSTNLHCAECLLFTTWGGVILNICYCLNFDFSGAKLLLFSHIRKKKE